MKLKRVLHLLALLLLSVPFAAQAAAGSTDIEYCGTPWPKWWWGWDGPRTQIDIQHWSIEPLGLDFRVSFDIVNTSSTTFYGGAEFSVKQAAVDPVGHPNPSQLTAPPSASSLLGTESLTRIVLPTLRPGEATRVSAFARGFQTGANHLLTLSYHDGAQVQIAPGDPSPTPWYWLRILNPSNAPGALRFVSGSVVPVSSTRPGYSASRVTIIVQNSGRSILQAGLPILVVHGNSASAGGSYSPDQDPVDPNDPGNPYAHFFREVIFQGQLSQALYPGESLTVSGTAFSPIGKTAIEQVTVEVGQ